MTKKLICIILMLAVLISASACSILPQSESISTAADASAAPASSITDKLSIGLLKLEGTALAVTDAQAGELIFLWKAVKALGTARSSSSLEIEALYAQIEEAMTTAQVQAIREMIITTEEVNSLVAQYGATSASSSTTKTSSLTNSVSQNASSGGMGGMPGGGNEMMLLNGGMPGGITASSTPSAQITAQKSSTSAGITDVNILLSGAVIQVLQARAAA